MRRRFLLRAVMYVDSMHAQGYILQPNSPGTFLFLFCYILFWYTLPKISLNDTIVFTIL